MCHLLMDVFHSLSLFLTLVCRFEETLATITGQRDELQSESLVAQANMAEVYRYGT